MDSVGVRYDGLTMLHRISLFLTYLDIFERFCELHRLCIYDLKSTQCMLLEHHIPAPASSSQSHMTVFKTVRRTSKLKDKRDNRPISKKRNKSKRGEVMRNVVK